ncbi:sulfurtransferase TusA family protein [Candidatus Desulforudis audaxviator]|uniref:SirA family protein n=1 Tax=Desulforudis audaxviator (strain MP104C) TaxID=477974 RepID=B1I112_DESAP|nr:sulfurtransferase TusA family protein [Candidatus Desulforudis audaxviator]ACA58631.1 SirA family protein [Candidatus Desulforudis audaxviator MP104C]AZK58629.1 putative redox protein [Candidatus Desulforudis audaxviator]
MPDVDVCGLVCPEPVLLVMRQIDAQGKGVITVLADSEAARENIKRLATGKGWTVTVEERDERWLLTLTK